MKKKKIKQFRIKEIQRGFITVYEAQIKTWWGWKGFWASEDGEFYFMNNPKKNKSRKMESIENMIKILSLKEGEYEIIK